MPWHGARPSTGDFLPRPLPLGDARGGPAEGSHRAPALAVRSEVAASRWSQRRKIARHGQLAWSCSLPRTDFPWHSSPFAEIRGRRSDYTAHWSIRSIAYRWIRFDSVVTVKVGASSLAQVRQALSAAWPVLRTMVASSVRSVPKGRGRDADLSAPPAQIRTGAANASGSYLEYLASKRRWG